MFTNDVLILRTASFEMSMKLVRMLGSQSSKVTPRCNVASTHHARISSLRTQFTIYLRGKSQNKKKLPSYESLYVLLIMYPRCLLTEETEESEHQS